MHILTVQVPTSLTSNLHLIHIFTLKLPTSTTSTATPVSSPPSASLCTWQCSSPSISRHTHRRVPVGASLKRNGLEMSMEGRALTSKSHLENRCCHVFFLVANDGFLSIFKAYIYVLSQFQMEVITQSMFVFLFFGWGGKT